MTLGERKKRTIHNKHMSYWAVWHAAFSVHCYEVFSQSGSTVEGNPASLGISGEEWRCTEK
jgi:hypothetical protein